MKLWLDDQDEERPTPEGWVRAHSVNEAIEILKTGKVVEASLDHDLGKYEEDGGPGIRLVYWMEANKVWPAKITIHTYNPSGSRMYEICRQYTSAQYVPYKG